jgi:hypothetical protein
MRVLISLAASLMLTLALAGPVVATGPGCSDFATGSAALAKEVRPFGQLVSAVKDGQVLPGYDNIGNLIQAEHHGDIFAWPCAKYAP